MPKSAFSCFLTALWLLLPCLVNNFPLISMRRWNIFTLRTEFLDNMKGLLGHLCQMPDIFGQLHQKQGQVIKIHLGSWLPSVSLQARLPKICEDHLVTSKGGWKGRIPSKRSRRLYLISCFHHLVRTGAFELGWENSTVCAVSYLLLCTGRCNPPAFYSLLVCCMSGHHTWFQLDAFS